MAERMGWRGTPSALWPEARSVIMLAEVYTPEEDPLAVLARRDRGAVSVYARGRDYHDLVKPRLKRLGRWLVAETGAAMLFISHDLETVRLITHRVAVLYLGRVAEEAPTTRLFARPAHPYTQALLSAHLPPDPFAPLRRHQVEGEIPSPVNLPPGCFFAGRCPIALPECRTAPPAPVTIEPQHSAACLRVASGTNRLMPVEDAR